MIYLEIVLLITVIVALLRQTAEKTKLEDQVKDIEGKLEGIEKLLIELQPKGPIEIPTRLPEETLKEVVPQLYKKKTDIKVPDEVREQIEFKKKQYELLKEIMKGDEELGLYEESKEQRTNFIDDTFDHMAQEDKKANEAKDEYMKVLASGMFWEWHPELTGNWEKDRLSWNKIYDDLLYIRSKVKE